MMEHIVQESAAVMAGSEHEDDFLFYHDALVQLTDEKTVEWMKTQQFGGKSYYERWLIPRGPKDASELPRLNDKVLGQKRQTPAEKAAGKAGQLAWSTAFAGRPTGDRCNVCPPPPPPTAAAPLTAPRCPPAAPQPGNDAAGLQPE